MLCICVCAFVKPILNRCLIFNGALLLLLFLQRVQMLVIDDGIGFDWMIELVSERFDQVFYLVIVDGLASLLGGGCNAYVGDHSSP